MNHNHTYKGRKVRIILKDGRKIVDNFEQGKSRVVHLRNHGALRRDAIKSLTLFTHQPEGAGR